MNEPVSLEQELGNLLDAPKESAQAPATPVASSNAPITEVPEASAVDSNRDDKGRFKVKEQAIDPAAQPTGEKPALGTEQQPNVAQQPTAVRPPDSWSVAAKAKFAALDPDIQQEVLKREQDIFKGLDQYKEGHQFAQTINKALQPYMATLQGLQLTPDRAITHLLSLDHQLRYGSPEAKAQTLAGIAQSFGIDITQLSTEQSQVDPTVSALRQELAQIKQHITQSQTAVHSAEQQNINGAIDVFRQDPANLYFENVRHDMSALLSSGAAKDLKDAYDKACWSNPEIRSVLLKQQSDEAEKKRLVEAAEKANRAKQAAFDVQGSGASHPNSGRALTLEEEIAAQLG